MKEKLDHNATVKQTIIFHFQLSIINFINAGMAELADAQDLGSCGLLRAGSSPVTRTNMSVHNVYMLWTLYFSVSYLKLALHILCSQELLL